MDRTAFLSTASPIMIGSAVVAFLASAGFAQVIHPDQMFGAFTPQAESRPGDSPASSDSAGSEPEKGFDRQMLVPDNEPSEGMGMNMLKTPDSKDADEARESDRQSSVSF